MDFHLNRDSPIPLRQQLEAQIEAKIRSGRLARNVFLPTVRDLAKQTNLNYNTVAEAYRSLTKKGFLAQRRRGGTQVVAEINHDLEKIADNLISQLHKAGIAIEQFLAIAQEKAKQNQEKPLKIVAVAESLSRANELVKYFINPLLPTEIRLATLQDFYSAGEDLVVTTASVIEKARSKPSRRPGAWRQHRQQFLALAEGAD